MLLAWGFNHEEAARCFAAAAAEDGTMAMAHWGLAFAGGLNYNRPTLSQEEMRCAARHAARAQAPPPPPPGRAAIDPVIRPSILRFPLLVRLLMNSRCE